MDQAQSEERKKRCSLLRCQCICCSIPQRVVFSLLMHLAMQCAYNLRAVLNMAIVEMVEPDKKTTKHACPQYFKGKNTLEHYGKTFKWSRNVQSEVLYAFFIGYSVSQIPGGLISDAFGGRWVIFFTLAVSVAVTVVLPVCTEHASYWVVIVLRTILGLVQGPIVPGMATMISKWIPSEESSLLGGIAYSGSNLGIVLGNFLTGEITHVFGSWHAPFYFWSVWCSLYLVLHIIWIYSYPHTSPSITKEELEYLEQKIPKKQKIKVPWKKILKNIPFWANVSGSFGHNYVFYLILTYLPTYMREILGYDITTIALLSSIPFFVLWIFSMTYNFTAKYIEKKITREMYNRILGPFSNIGCAVCALGACYFGCDRLWVMILFTLSMVIKPLSYPTFAVNINEMSKNYSGTVMAIVNTISNIGGIFGNYLVGEITTDGTMAQWKLVFWICLGITVATSMVYGFFSSTKRQEFDILPGET